MIILKRKYTKYIVTLIFYELAYINSISCSAVMSNVHDSHIQRTYSENTVLVMGCVIFEHQFIKRRPFLIALKYKTRANVNRIKLILVRADSLGYFALSNMPKGLYAIHGVQARRGSSWYYNLEEADNSWGISRPEVYEGDTMISNISIIPGPREPLSWPDPKGGNMYDLGYTILVRKWRDYPSPRYIEHASHYPILNRMEPGEVQSGFRSSVPRYFLDKYPQSEWNLYLKKVIR